MYIIHAIDTWIMYGAARGTFCKRSNVIQRYIVQFSVKSYCHFLEIGYWWVHLLYLPVKKWACFRWVGGNWIRGGQGKVANGFYCRNIVSDIRINYYIDIFDNRCVGLSKLMFYINRIQIIFPIITIFNLLSWDSHPQTMTAPPPNGTVGRMFLCMSFFDASRLKYMSVNDA